MKKLVALVALLVLFVSVFSQEIPERPSPPRLVNDFAGLLQASELSALESKLVGFNDSTSTQIVIVIVASLNGSDKVTFATTLHAQWGVGQEKKNNGIVILIKPKTDSEKGEAFISIGYGLEGVIPDATSKLIVENEMIPNFKSGNYNAGIDAAVNTLMSLAKGEFSADKYSKKGGKTTRYIVIGIIIFVLLIIFSAMRKRKGGGGFSSGSVIGSGMLFGASSGSWGSFSSGGGSFGGFGGGSCGGGGAGGSW